MEVERIGFKDKLSTARMNLEVFACTGILVLVSFLYYLIGFNNFTNVSSLNYALRVIYIYLISVSTSVLWDFLFYLYKLFGKKKISFKEYLFKVFSSFSFVSGGIIALLLPIGTKLYLIPLATFVGIVLKNITGGYGNISFNPAIVGVIIASIFKPNYYLGEIVEELTSEVTFRTTPLFQTLAFPNSYSEISSRFRIDLWDIFNGFYVGEIGTTQSFALIIILVYLMGRKIVDYRLSITFIFSYFIMSFLLFSLSNIGIASALYNSFVYTIVGPTLFIGVFVISDPSNSPLTSDSKIMCALTASLSLFICKVTFDSIVSMYYYYYFFLLGVNSLFMTDKFTIVGKDKTHIFTYIFLIMYLLISVGFISFYLRGKNMLFFQ